MNDRDFTRRGFLQASAGAAGGVAAYPAIVRAAPAAEPSPQPVRTPDMIDIVLEVNGTPHRLAVEPRVTPLDALRERLGLYGTKKGCARGACGACTVHIDGRRVIPGCPHGQARTL
jgi:xanthine dehydrogenase YagT iron-sulfur-binding subunit